MGVAAAIVGASVVGAGASIAAGSAAAGATRDAAAQSNATQLQMYNQTREDQAPYRAVGYGALGKLAAMYGVAPVNSDGTSNSSVGSDWNAYLQQNGDVMQAYNGLSSADRQRFPTAQSYAQFHYNTFGQNEGRALPTTANDNTGGANDNKYGGFETSPGYQFRVDQAMRAIQNSAAARGLLKSGATVKAINSQVQGIASDEFNTYANRLAALAGVGQVATNATAAAGQNAASAISQGQLAAGNATASAYSNAGNAINNGVQNIASGYLYTKGYGAGGVSGNYGVGTSAGPIVFNNGTSAGLGPY